MIANLIQTVMASSINKSQLGGQKEMSDGNLLVLLITMFIVLAILLVAGKYIWNEVLVVLIPGIKPLESVTQLLLLWFLMNILFCCK